MNQILKVYMADGNVVEIETGKATYDEVVTKVSTNEKQAYVYKKDGVQGVIFSDYVVRIELVTPSVRLNPVTAVAAMSAGAKRRK